MQKVLSAFAGLLASTSFAMAIPPAMTPNIGEVGTNFVKTDLEGCKLLSQPGIEISTIKHMANGRVESTFTVPETQPSSEIRNKIFSDREQVEVTFEVKDSENFPGALPRSLYVMSLEYPGIRWSLQLMGEPSGTLTLPKGDYVVATSFAARERIWLYSDLTVSEETTYEVCADEAIYPVKANFKVPGGEPMIFRTFDPDTGEQTDDYFNTIVFIGDYTMTYKGCTAFGTRVIDENEPVEDVISFYTNVNTDDGCAVCSWISYMPDNVKLTDGINLPLSEATQNGLTNNLDTYRMIDSNMFHSTDDERYPASLEEFILYNSESTVLQGFISGIPLTHTIYIGGGIYGENTDFTTFNVNITTYNDWDSLDVDGIVTPECAKTPDGFIFLATNPWIAEDRPFDNGVYFNPAFSYSTDNMTFGGSNAYSIVRLLEGFWNDEPFYYPEMSKWYGNAGENRKVDSRFTNQTLTLNGQEVDLSEYYDDMMSYMEWQYNNNVDLGIVTASWTNDNIEFEGEKGTATNCITYDQTSEDKSLPTLTYLSFRNNEGIPTYVFKNTSDGKLCLSAGSFEYKREAVEIPPRTYAWSYYDYAPAQVKVEYSSHEANNWKELPLYEDASKFFVPGFGAYYEGSLEGVTSSATEGLFDLRVTVVNETGASQVQTLSPAFKIDGMSGVEEVSLIKDATFLIEDSCVRTIEGGEVSVWTLTGSQVANENLAPGVYVARSGKSCAKITVK